ncbi:hypothetical protein [Streptomyces sp. NPDC001970]
MLPEWLENIVLALFLLVLVTVGVHRLLGMVRAARAGDGAVPPGDSGVR